MFLSFKGKGFEGVTFEHNRRHYYPCLDDFSKEKTNIQPISNANTVKAPMLGTLYHAPSPKSQPFIKEGKKVKEGDILFIIEAMKTMNQVKSDRTGVVKKILVENGLPVEFNQDLVIIE